MVIRRKLKYVLLRNDNRQINPNWSISQYNWRARHSHPSLRKDIIQGIVDLKMVNFLLGWKGEYTKNSNFISFWDSRPKGEPWVRRQWLLRENMPIGEKISLKNLLLTEIILFPLYIKLEMMTQLKSFGHRRDVFWIHV